MVQKQEIILIEALLCSLINNMEGEMHRFWEYYQPNKIQMFMLVLLSQLLLTH